MNRVPFLVVALSCWTLAGCGSDTAKDTATATGDAAIQPQEGNWPMVTATWVNDGCNAEEGLQPPSSVSFSNVDATSFSLNLYDTKGVQIGDGNSTCESVGGNTYDCVGFTQTLAYTKNGIIHMTGVDTITLASETEASGNAQLISECLGTDCPFMALETNTGSFPCETGLSWTAAAE